MRINLNGGWLWDRMVDRHYLLYGIGGLEIHRRVAAHDRSVRPGRAVRRSERDPAAVQAGVRYRPNEIFSVDLIYGRNIMGENASWLTIGTTIRFPPPESKPARERSAICKLRYKKDE